MKFQSLRTGQLIAVMILSFLTLNIARAQILFSAGSPYTQNFDTLASNGLVNAWSDNSTLPGWYATKSLGGATIATYRASLNTAGENNGALYSYGATNGGTLGERALGSCSSGTPGDFAYGVRFQNDTAQTITNIVISFTGEQWRNGGNTAVQTLSFSHRSSFSAITDSDAGNTATWVSVPALNFNTPVVGATAATVDGNAGGNRTAINNVALAGVVVAPTEEIMLRWRDINDAGNDHGVALDDMTITWSSIAPNNNPPSINTQPASVTNFPGKDVSFSVSASGQAPLSYQWYFTNAASGLVEISGAVNSTLNVPTVTSNNAGIYYVVVANGLGSIQSSNAILVVRPVVVTNIAYLRSLKDGNYNLTDFDTVFQVEGIVTTPVNLVVGSPAYSCFMSETGSLRGMNLFYRNGYLSGVPNPGDYIRVTAPLDFFNGLLELHPASSVSGFSGVANPAHNIEVLSSGNPLPTPRVMSMANANNPAVMDDLEGSYVVVSNVFLDTTLGNFAPNGTVTALTISNASGQTFVLFNPTAPNDVHGQAIPAFCSSIRGWITQNDGTSPYDSNYQLQVMLYSDLTPGTPPVGPVPGTPRITSAVKSGSNVVVSGVDGTFDGTYHVLTSTSISTPRASWTSVATNNFDGSGNFNFNVPISGSQQFIDIEQQP